MAATHPTNDRRQTEKSIEVEMTFGGDGSERFADWLDDAPRWLYERAGIDDLSRSEINRLAREELARRRTDGRITDDPQSVYAWLFVEFALFHDRPREESGGGSDD